uniref:Uncharacterized protein n=1 Tax=Anguilla anguilla TaxID=7936 RepID=A0A0E9TLU7_ANGAN
MLWNKVLLHRSSGLPRENEKLP